MGAELPLEMTLPPALIQGSSRSIRCRCKIVRVEEPDANGQIGVAATVGRFRFVRPDQPQASD